MTARFRRLYGAGPLHLLALASSLLVAGAAITGWFQSFPGPTAVKILEWFVAAIVAHDLVLLPLYSLVDRIAFGSGARHRAQAPPAHVPAVAYVRIPLALSALLFLVFFPEILRLGDSTFFTASGFHQRVYLARYLLTCGVLFALSGLAYAVRVSRIRAKRGSDRLCVANGEQDERERSPIEEPTTMHTREEPRRQHRGEGLDTHGGD